MYICLLNATADASVRHLKPKFLCLDDENPAAFGSKRVLPNLCLLLRGADVAGARLGGCVVMGCGIGHMQESGETLEAESTFPQEVSSTFLRCKRDGFDHTNAVIELNSLKIAEDRTFADCARYIIVTILGASCPRCQLRYMLSVQSLPCHLRPHRPRILNIDG